MKNFNESTISIDRSGKSTVNNGISYNLFKQIVSTGFKCGLSDDNHLVMIGKIKNTKCLVKNRPVIHCGSSVKINENIAIFDGDKYWIEEGVITITRKDKYRFDTVSIYVEDCVSN